MEQILKKYKYTIVATDIIIFTIIKNKLNVLLIKMKKAPYQKYWATPGGLVKIDESVLSAAKRIIFEKTGLKNMYLEQLYTFGEVNRDPFGRVVSVAYFSLMSGEGIKIKTSEEYDEIKWFPAEKLPKLAYDHKKITNLAIERLKSKLGYTNIVYGLLPNFFTLSELQKTYEIILGEKMDKRNFRKKILSLGIIKKTGRITKGKTYRPASLYEFIEKKSKIIKIF